LGAATAAALTGGTLGVAGVASAADAPVDVRAGQLTTWDAAGTAPMPSGWFLQKDNQLGAGTVEIVGDSSAGANGDGSLHLVTPASADKVALQHAPATATTLSGATGSYRYRINKGAQPAVYQITVNCGTGDLPAGFTSLNLTVDDATAGPDWTTVDIATATFWTSRTINADGTTAPATTDPTAGGFKGGSDQPGHTLAEFATACTGDVVTYGVSMGSQQPGLDSSVDQIAFGAEATNFEYVDVPRYAGADRIGTAVEASKARFGAGAAKAVVLANSDVFADAVAGGPLAGTKGGPLLLTKPTSLSAATANEIKRVLPAGGTVYVLGGPAAITAGVENAVKALGVTTVRLAGAERYDTAVEVAKAIGTVGTVFLTTGTDYPDALSAGPAAVHVAEAAVLLTHGSVMAPATQAYLAANPVKVTYAVGGPAAKAAPSAQAINGADRFETAVLTAKRFFADTDTLTFASGEDFPDALSGGAYAGLVDAPVVLLKKSGVPAVVKSYLDGSYLQVETASLFGGPVALSDATLASVEHSLNYGS
jgi:putative cell wall-binding protein